jgi:ketosteroid isomerase-like protein
MRRTSVVLLVTIIIVVAISGSTALQSAQSTKLQFELREVLQQRWDALARKDAKAFSALLDDDVLVIDLGSVYDKKALIERVAALKETSSEPRDLQVHGDNHAAVMIYRTTSHVLLAGQEFTEELRVVESYVKRNGRWLLTARAESEIPNANRVAAKVDPKLLDEYVGEYQIAPGNVVKITREGDHLMERGPDDPEPVADLPLSKNAFFQREQPGVLTFRRSSDGKVDALVLWIYDSTIIGNARGTVPKPK